MSVILTSTGGLDKENRNHLLYEFRLNYHSDKWANTVEWLFQLARHWADWQSPRIGTFPMEYRDPSGPSDRETSEATGEDSTYWTIFDIIHAQLAESAPDCAPDGTLNDYWEGPGDEVQDLLVHTTAVLRHLLFQLEENGHGN